MKLVSGSTTTVERVTCVALESLVDNSGNASLPRHGKKLNVHVGAPKPPTAAVSADDMLNQQSSFGFSGRQNMRNMWQWRKWIEGCGVKVAMPSRRAVDEARDERTGDLFTTAAVPGNIATEAKPTFKDIEVVHCNDIRELCRRVCAHRGLPVDVIKIQGDHGQDVLKISIQITPSNSVDRLQILAATSDSKESIRTLTSMFGLINVESLVSMGAHVIFAGDLKFIQLMMGIKTGNAMYPCPWCWWKATGTDRDPVDAVCTKRDVLKDYNDFVQLGSNRARSSRCHGQQATPCVSVPLIADPSECISPCTLHVTLGLVNALDEAMLRRAADAVAELYRVSNITKSPYQGGTLEGNQCYRLVKAVALSEWAGDHPLHAFKPLFCSLHQLYVNVFTARCDLRDEDIAEIEAMVSEFVELWKSSSHELELTRPLKLHVLAVHVVAFTAAHRATPAMFGEQDGESSHRVFRQLMDTFRSMGPRALLHAVKVFNACRF